MSLLGLLPNPWVIAGVALAITGAWGTGELHGHSRGVDSKQAEWNADKLERAAAQDESNRLANRAAAKREDEKLVQRAVVVSNTKEVSHALEAAPAWRDAELPPSVRDALVTAAAAIAAASQPDRVVPAASAADVSNERGSGAGISVRPGWLERMLRPASSPG